MGRAITDPLGIARLMGRNNKRWGRGKTADGQCYTASIRLALALVQRGWTAAYLIRCDFTRYGMVMGNHFAVVLDSGDGEIVYDLTARQFGEHLDWPLILPRVEWEALMVEIADGDAETEFEIEAA